MIACRSGCRPTTRRTDSSPSACAKGRRARVPIPAPPEARALPRSLDVLTLRAIQAWDRHRLRRLAAAHPGFQLHPTASTNLAVARIEMGPGAVLQFGANVVTERIPGALRLVLGAGARVEIGDRTWLRTEIEPIHIAVFAGARLVLGPDSWLSGCHLSAKHAILCGRKTWIGNGCRVFDSDQHDLDDVTQERGAPITLGDNVWIPADITILRGVTIGSNCVIGTRSLVTRSIPPHTIAHGFPAVPRGTVGDRANSP